MSCPRLEWSSQYSGNGFQRFALLITMWWLVGGCHLFCYYLFTKEKFSLTSCLLDMYLTNIHFHFNHRARPLHRPVAANYRIKGPGWTIRSWKRCGWEPGLRTSCGMLPSFCTQLLNEAFVLSTPVILDFPEQIPNRCSVLMNTVRQRIDCSNSSCTGYQPSPSGSRTVTMPHARDLH